MHVNSIQRTFCYCCAASSFCMLFLVHFQNSWWKWRAISAYSVIALTWVTPLSGLCWGRVGNASLLFLAAEEKVHWREIWISELRVNCTGALHNYKNFLVCKMWLSGRGRFTVSCLHASRHWCCFCFVRYFVHINNVCLLVRLSRTP